MKQIKVRAAMRRRERWIEQRDIGEEAASGFPAIGAGELSTNGWQAEVESLEGATIGGDSARRGSSEPGDAIKKSGAGLALRVCSELLETIG